MAVRDLQSTSARVRMSRSSGDEPTIASVIAAEKAKNANGVSAPQPSLPSQTLTERLWLVGAADHHGHAAVSAASLRCSLLTLTVTGLAICP